jgi:hypothetical protein
VIACRLSQRESLLAPPQSIHSMWRGRTAPPPRGACCILPRHSGFSRAARAPSPAPHRGRATEARSLFAHVSRPACATRPPCALALAERRLGVADRGL